MRETASPAQFLTFYIADEEYAIGILQVKEIIEYTTITKVPNTPSCISGVINLRGSVVPIIDLAVKLGLAATPVTKFTCIVIVEMEMEEGKILMGIIAEAVNQVIDLYPDDIEPTPYFGTLMHVDYLLGMGKVASKFVLILNVDKVLSAQELLTSSQLSSLIPEAEMAQ